MNIKVGTCGFGRRKRSDYAKNLSIVEVQHTFYEPPKKKELEKWRAEMPEGFEFTVKAWQLITHATKSPTYRRLKRELDEKERAEAGYFRPTEIVREGWRVTLECAKILKAKTILFQCPASFKPYPENLKNLKKFMGSIDREGLDLCWEPRGEWSDETIGELCEELSLRHVVDPFERRTTTPGTPYFRLHGRGGWRYKYEDDELDDLLSLLPDAGDAYVFFNNSFMMDDAVRFQNLVNERR